MITRFLKNLAGASLEDPDPQRRLRAIEQLDARTPAEELAAFAVDEPDAGVRTACIQRIDDAPVLLGLMEHPPTQAAARTRLTGLIDAGLQARALLTGLDDTALIRHLLDATGAEADWQAVLARLEGEDLMVEIAGHHRLAPVRAAAARRVIHEEPLRQLERVARERDKDVARSVRERLDALRAARQEAESLAQRVAQLETDARHLLRAEEEPRIAERFERLTQQAAQSRAGFEGLGAAFALFEQTPPAPPEALAALEAHCRAFLERETARREAEEAAARAAADASARQHTLESVLTAVERLAEQLGERLADGERALSERSTLEAAVAFEDARWADALAEASSDPALIARHRTARDRVAQLLGALARMADAPPPPGATNPGEAFGAAAPTAGSAPASAAEPAAVASSASTPAEPGAASGALSGKPSEAAPAATASDAAADSGIAAAVDDAQPAPAEAFGAAATAPPGDHPAAIGAERSDEDAAAAAPMPQPPMPHTPMPHPPMSDPPVPDPASAAPATESAAEADHAATGIAQAPPDAEALAAAERAAERAAEHAPAIVDDPALVTVAEPLPGDPQTAAALWSQRAAARSTLQELDQWLTALDWPKDIPMPEAVARVSTHADALRAAITAIDDREQRLATRIGKLCGRLERALDARKLKPAGGMFADLKRQLALLQEPDAKLQQRVERSRERLEELRDWEYFATAPKREALCVELEALAAAADVTAEARAARVKEARAEWKSFGPLRGEDGKALAKRFDDAAEQAFAPAREHFEAQAEQRAENSRQRARICDELQQFLDSYDWDAADWKGVERIYRRARDDWQKFADVDASGRALGKRYHRLSRDLRARLEARWKENIARKEALVASAAALVVDGNVVPGAPGQAKALQQQWKDVDITPRSADRELWKAFRAACDAVFSTLEKARDAEVHDHVALRDTLQIATRALRDALSASRVETRAELDALPTAPVQSAFDALRADPVPRDARKATDAALRAARDALQQVRDEKRELEARARLGQLRTALQLDVTLADLDDQAAVQATVDAAELSAPWRSAVQARLARQEDAGASADASADRHAACVDLELALGLDSPPEDADLRLARQVARLSSGLRGEANDDPQARIHDAIARLLACPAHSDRDRELARRALAAIERHLGPSAAARSGAA